MRPAVPPGMASDDKSLTATFRLRHTSVASNAVVHTAPTKRPPSKSAQSCRPGPRQWGPVFIVARLRHDPRQQYNEQALSRRLQLALGNSGTVTSTAPPAVVRHYQQCPVLLHPSPLQHSGKDCRSRPRSRHWDLQDKLFISRHEVAMPRATTQLLLQALSRHCTHHSILLLWRRSPPQLYTS
jgi:hypothetical protein